MNRKRLFLTVIMSFLLAANISIAGVSDIIFRSQRGAILDLFILEDNKILGSFRTGSAFKPCPKASGQERPITGYLVGNSLTFSVAYPICDSVLSMTGNFDAAKETIDTIYILNKQATDLNHEGPGLSFIWHDTYTRVE